MTITEMNEGRDRYLTITGDDYAFEVVLCCCRQDRRHRLYVTPRRGDPVMLCMDQAAVDRYAQIKAYPEAFLLEQLL